MLRALFCICFGVLFFIFDKKIRSKSVKNIFQLIGFLYIVAGIFGLIYGTK
ncbi:MAG: hypothetical protein HUK18_00150 [Bacteroidales bacterium]|nr:hypothetical protein [Bacteroidales bacterium]